MLLVILQRNESNHTMNFLLNFTKASYTKIKRYPSLLRTRYVIPLNSYYCSTKTLREMSTKSPFDPTNKNADTTTTKKKIHRTFIPRKAAVKLTDKARSFFKVLLKEPPRKDVIGIMLNYDQSKTGEPRMVFSFSFVTANEIDFDQDEGVSLELVTSIDVNGEESLVPKSPVDSRSDGLPKLYIHHNAFLKVLGATIDVDTETITPILYDREGNRMDPNF